MRLERILKEKNLSRVLDFGCGAGRHTIHLARNGFKAHGFDALASAVGRATQLLHDEELRADLRAHDMLEPLPYPAMFFDTVLATRVIHHTLVENIKRIVSENYRVLKNGGYMFLQVPEYGDHEQVLREARSTHRVLEPGTHAPLEGGRSPPLLHKGRTAVPLSKLHASGNPCKQRSLPRFLPSGREGWPRTGFSP